MLTIYNSKGGHIFGGLTIELHEQNAEQKKRIAELEELLVLKETLHFEPPFYYANGDSV